MGQRSRKEKKSKKGSLAQDSSPIKRRFPLLRRVFRKILSTCLPCVFRPSEEDDSPHVPTQESGESVNRQNKCADGMKRSHSDTDVSKNTNESSQQEKKPSAGREHPVKSLRRAISSCDLNWTSMLRSAFFKKKEQTKQPVDESLDALGFPNLGNTCFMNSVLQSLLSVSPFIEDLLSQRDQYKKKTLLRALSDLHRSRVDGNKADRIQLARIRKCIPEIKRHLQQDAHEFLTMCLFHLKEEGASVKKHWPIYNCPVANMEFKLKNRRTCNSCGFQTSHIEDSNYLSLPITPEASLTHSLQQYWNESLIECVCSSCGGTTARQSQAFLTFPRVLILMISRFDTMSLCKLSSPLRIPEELAVFSDQVVSREDPASDCKIPTDMDLSADWISLDMELSTDWISTCMGISADMDLSADWIPLDMDLSTDWISAHMGIPTDRISADRELSADWISLDMELSTDWISTYIGIPIDRISADRERSADWISSNMEISTDWLSACMEISTDTEISADTDRITTDQNAADGNTVDQNESDRNAADQSESDRNKSDPNTTDRSTSVVPQYKLSAVVSHLGNSLYSGHFVSFFHDPSNNTWIGCSDSLVRRYNWRVVSQGIQKNAYLLFYVKRS